MKKLLSKTLIFASIVSAGMCGFPSSLAMDNPNSEQVNNSDPSDKIVITDFDNDKFDANVVMSRGNSGQHILDQEVNDLNPSDKIVITDFDNDKSDANVVMSRFNESKFVLPENYFNSGIVFKRNSKKYDLLEQINDYINSSLINKFEGNLSNLIDSISCLVNKELSSFSDKTNFSSVEVNCCKPVTKLLTLFGGTCSNSKVKYVGNESIVTTNLPLMYLKDDVKTLIKNLSNISYQNKPVVKIKLDEQKRFCEIAINPHPLFIGITIQILAKHDECKVSDLLSQLIKEDPKNKFAKNLEFKNNNFNAEGFVNDSFLNRSRKRD